MGSIHVKFLSTLSAFFKAQDVTLLENEISLKDLIKQLGKNGNGAFEEKILGKKGLLNKYVIVQVNGEDIRAASGLETVLRDGDQITFLPAIAGG